MKYLAITLILSAALLTGYVMGMVRRSQPLSMAMGCALFAEICFMWCMFLYPCIAYSRFLKDMTTGLTREVIGGIEEVSDKEELQDGVRVHPVRILLDSEQDERILYLDVSKAEGFPAVGTKVRLNCFGRHIKEVVPA